MFDFITSTSTYFRWVENIKNGNWFEFIPLILLVIFIVINEALKMHKSRKTNKK